MPYWQLFYHFVTATKDRQPILTPVIETIIFEHIREKCKAMGVELFALNGFEDHIHLVVSVPPRIAVANFIGQLKGYASSQYNQYHPQSDPFFWQTEYGVFSFDKKRLPACVEYVERQKEHHREGKTITVLERTQEFDPHQVSENPASYITGSHYEDPF